MIDEMTVSIRKGSVCLEINETSHVCMYVLNRITSAEKSYVEFHEWYAEEWPEMEKFLKSDKGQEFLLDVCRRAAAFRKFLEEDGNGIALALLILSRGVVGKVNKELEGADDN